MIIAVPETITLSSSTIPEPASGEPAVYNASTSYNVNDLVVYNHRIWKCLDTGVVGVTPGSNPLKWSDQGSTRQYAMIDESVGTVTWDTIPITVTIPVTKIVDRLTMFNVTGASVRVTLVKDTITLLDTTVDLRRNAPITSWTEYFFTPFEYRSDLTIRLPLYINAQITVTINPLGGYAAIGHITMGRSTQLGFTLYGASPSIIDYSRKEVDESGNYFLQQGRFSKRATLAVSIDTPQIDNVYRIMSSVRGIPIIWVGGDDEGFESLLIYGFFREFTPVIQGFSKSEYSLEIEGLT